ncbi:MAG TPA: tRNA (adenosine(37)-N6)-threonylcarbamoyltransferase complex ATPase subunit type 1 TsaE [Deltaproteobacteria bacterium]|nr:tRNA (adenosine(37)-N6)-threonylcarbamoyltransferase complex ATPase subunit type 1 TsaE [Deltaproteobacteria bacterium]
MKFTHVSTSPDATFALAKRLGTHLHGGEIILLSGDLGAGKTLFTRGLADGVQPGLSSEVVSPSFTLVNIYQARLDIIHVDLYRLDSDEIYTLGLEDLMERDRIVVVEWAERARQFFTGDVVEITMNYLDETTRSITVETSLLSLAGIQDELTA